MNDTINIEKLKNGITCYKRSLKDIENYLFLCVTVKVGSAMEDSENNGISHFIEHMQMAFDKNREQCYFSCCAYTDFYYTSYYFEIPVNNILLAKSNILKILSGEFLTESLLEDVRFDVLNEFDNNYGKCHEWDYLLQNSEYLNHLAIGKRENIENFSLSEILDFFNKWYCADRIALILIANPELMQGEEIGNFIREVSEVNLPVSNKDEERKIFWELPIYNKIVDISHEKQNKLVLYYKQNNADIENWIDEIVSYKFINKCIENWLKENNVFFNSVFVEKYLLSFKYSFIRIEISGIIKKEAIYLSKYLPVWLLDFCITVDDIELCKIVQQVYLDVYNDKGYGINLEHVREECINNFIFSEPLYSYDDRYNHINHMLKIVNIYNINRRLKRIYTLTPLIIIRNI